MSTDAIADALVNACESSIKYLSQFLTNIHSIDALHRLNEKTDVVQAFSIIASFAPILVPEPQPVPLTAVDESLAEASFGRLEHQVDEMPKNEGSAGLGGEQEETMPGLAQTRFLAHLATFDDGDDVVPPSSQATRRVSPILPLPLPLDDYSDLLHGHRPPSIGPDEWRLQQAKTKPLYSILVYFPILTQYQTRVGDSQKRMLESIVVERPNVGGASMKHPLLSAEIYPRIRLVSQFSLSQYNAIDCQSIALVMDDNPERLRATQMRLLAAQRTF